MIKNAKMLSQSLEKLDYRIVSGGTDTHLLLVDLDNKGLTGRVAAATLDKANITVNKNLIPFDKKPASVTSGIRLGTPAVTTRGMKERQMEMIAALIDEILSYPQDDSIINKVKKEVLALTKKFPLYADLR